MPTYQYACTACDERLEAVQSFTDAPLTECPACGGALRKVFSAVGVVFKGSGFYKTDSRAKTPAAASETKTDSKTKTTSDSKGDKATSTPAASSSASSSGSSGSSSGGSSGSYSGGSASSASSSTPASKSA